MAEPHEHNRSKYEQLVQAVATGTSMSQWCRDNDVPRSTAQSWKTSTFEADVRAVRRELQGEAHGVLANSVKLAAAQMRQLVVKALTDRDKLAASEAILRNYREFDAIARHGEEIAELQSRLDILEGLDHA